MPNRFGRPTPDKKSTEPLGASTDTRRTYKLNLASFSSVMVDLHSSREAGSAQGPPSATERRECKSRVTLLLRDADSGQIDHMAAEPTHGPHHPCTSSSRLGARGTLLAIANV